MSSQGRSLTIACAITALSLVSADGAYRIVGWLGVGVLGLLIAFVAFQADMDTIAPIGSAQNTDLYTSSLQDQERMGRSEKAARYAENARTLKALIPFKVIGVALAAVGLAGFFWFQLPP